MELGLLFQSLFLLQGSHPRFTGENMEKNKVLYTRFANLAAKHGCTPPQLALAWLMHQGDDVVPIPGTIPSLLQMFIHIKLHFLLHYFRVF